MKAPSPFWQLLFAAEASTNPPTAVTMKLLTKRGRPLLLLPRQPHLATSGLELYPAQTPRSRFVRFLVAWALQTHLSVGVKSIQVHLSLDDPFVQWLAGRAHGVPGGIPQFAVLAGNPNSAGQRLILMLFDPAGRPAAVIKAGVTEVARKLIAQEQQFLESAPPDATGLPPMQGTFANARLRAIALDFLPGRSPREPDEQMLPKFLGNWLRPLQSVVFTETRAWRELAATGPDHPIFKSLADLLLRQSGSGALVHGDFAPWNIRVSPAGVWTALDWERGELNGLPGWDWFHYVIQKSILVQRQPVTALAASLERLLAGNQFGTYARAAGIIGHERSLVLGYLLYQAEVIRPSEGLAATRELLTQLAARWR